MEYERGHRTLKILRKGGKHAVIPLAPRTSRALDFYIGERTTGPIFVGGKQRLHRMHPTSAVADRRSDGFGRDEFESRGVLLGSAVDR